MVETRSVVDTTFIDIYVDSKHIPTCRYNIQYINRRTMEKYKISMIMWGGVVWHTGISSRLWCSRSRVQSLAGPLVEDLKTYRPIHFHI